MMNATTVAGAEEKHTSEKPATLWRKKQAPSPRPRCSFSVWQVQNDCSKRLYLESLFVKDIST